MTTYTEAVCKYPEFFPLKEEGEFVPSTEDQDIISNAFYEAEEMNAEGETGYYQPEHFLPKEWPEEKKQALIAWWG